MVPRRVSEPVLQEIKKQIAEMLEMSEGTSKWHLSNAREMLKKLVTGVFAFILFIK